RPSKNQETVEVSSLSTFFERYRIERCGFLKLDCEGCEFELVLDSDPKVINRIDRIVMEYHDHLSIRFSHRDLLEALTKLGFEAVAYNAKGTYGMIAADRKALR